jgi:hypothetical protein
MSSFIENNFLGDILMSNKNKKLVIFPDIMEEVERIQSFRLGIRILTEVLPLLLRLVCVHYSSFIVYTIFLVYTGVCITSH